MDFSGAVAYLIAAGVQATKRDKLGNTALHYALCNAPESTVGQCSLSLVRAGCQIQETKGKLLLVSAIRALYLEILRQYYRSKLSLMDHQIQRAITGMVARILCSTCSNDFSKWGEIFHFFSLIHCNEMKQNSQGAKPIINLFNIIERICKQENLKMRLFDFKYTSDQTTIWLLFCKTGNVEVIKFLLKKGAGSLETNIDGLNCIDMAIASGQEEAVKFLISSGVRPNMMIGDTLKNLEIDLAIKKFVIENCSSPPSLKSCARFSISGKFDALSVKGYIPETLIQYIKYERT